MAKRGFFTVDGSRLYYEMAGDGPPLILLHGGQTDSRMWDGQIDIFAQHCHVVRYDQRAYGQSETSSEPYAAHDDLHVLLGALEIDQAHLLGHSGGGALALDFALVYPDRTSSLMLFASGISGYDWSNMNDYSVQMGACFERGDVAAMAEVSLCTWTDGPNRTPDQVDSAVRERIRTLTTALFSRFIESGGPNERPLEPPAIGRLSEIQVPTLVILGQNDDTELLNIADMLTTEIANASKVLLPNGAHMTNMEDPESFNQAILNFLLTVQP